MTQENLRRPGRYLLAEGVVVVLSILTAFGLDAWWGGRQQASELRLELTNVLREIEDKRHDEIQEGDPLPTMGQVRYPNRVIVRNQTRNRRVVVQGTLRGFRDLTEELAAIEERIAAYLPT